MKDEVNLPQNCSPAGALIVPSHKNGARLQENSEVVVADAISAPLLAVPGDTTMARGHVNESLLTAYTFSVFGRGDSHPREQEERTGVLIRDEKLDPAIEPGNYGDVVMQVDLSDGTHNTREVTCKLAGQLRDTIELVYCSQSEKQPLALSAGSLAIEHASHEVSRVLPACRARQGIDFSEESNRLLPTGSVPSQCLRSRSNNVGVKSKTHACRGRVVELSHSPSVFLRMRKHWCRWKSPPSVLCAFVDTHAM